VIQLIGLEKIPIIHQNDNLVNIILNAINQMELTIEDNDIFVITQKIISRSEGRLQDLKSVTPSKKALRIAKIIDKDPRLVTLMLEESKAVLRMKMIGGIGKIIVEMKSGVICADAGIDQSNTPNNLVTLLPADSDESAAKIRAEILEKTQKDVAVIISDSHGRPFRNAAVNIAIGVAGIKEIKDYRGKIDLFGYRLQKKQIAIADELASAAELVIGEADEATPIVLIRGYHYEDKDGKAQRLIRTPDQDLFR